MKPSCRPLLPILLAVFFVLAVAGDLYAQKRIGVIMTGDIPYYRTIHESFVAGLKRRLGDSGKIEIILQRPFPDPIAWSNAARKLIAFDMDLIVAYGAPAARAVIHEKSDIPLVYAGVYEPEKTSMQGRKITGCGFKVPLSSIVRYFNSLKTINKIGVVCSSIEEDSLRQYEKMKANAERRQIRVDKIDIRSRRDLNKLKVLIPDAVFITGSSLAHLWVDDILSILREKKVPSADIFPDGSEAGVLMTLFQPSHEQGEMAAKMAAHILRGKKPGDIKIYTFRDTELVFNLREAKHLGITFPIQLLIEATRVIE